MAFPILGTPRPQFSDSSGVLASGTVQILNPADDTNATYYPTADDADAGTNGQTGDITLNANGYTPDGLFGTNTGTYKIVVKDSSGSTIWTEDDIHMPGSSARVMYAQGGANDADRTVQARLRDYASIMDFERATDTPAAGDGTTDDTAAVNAAITWSSSNSRPVDGLGRTYAVTGNISLLANTHLRNATFKQLTPDAAGDVRTLTSSSVNNITLINVKVDKNGDGSNGVAGSDAAIWISGGSGHHFEDVEVTGADVGSGIAIHSATDFKLIRPHPHDLSYDLASDPGADTITALWLNGCTRFSVDSPKVENITGNYSGITDERRHTKGIGIGGCVEWNITGGTVYYTDEAIDVTGSAGNREFSITGVVVSESASVGFKFANTAARGVIANCLAKDGGHGFVVLATSLESTTTEDLLFMNCVSINAGKSQLAVYHPSWYGFDIQQGGSGAEAYPRNIRFLNCQAWDNQGTATMLIGFRNQVTGANITHGRINTTVNCHSRGHTSEAFHDFAYPILYTRINSAQTITTGTGSWTAITWDEDVIDTAQMHDTSSNKSRLVAPELGTYEIIAEAEYAANSTGNRGIRIVNSGGTTIGRSGHTRKADQSTQTVMRTTAVVQLDAADWVAVETQQDSGGNLDITASGSQVSMKKIGDAYLL